jgi:hypothetical protein
LNNGRGMPLDRKFVHCTIFRILNGQCQRIPSTRITHHRTERMETPWLLSSCWLASGFWSPLLKPVVYERRAKRPVAKPTSAKSGWTSAEHVQEVQNENCHRLRPNSSDTGALCVAMRYKTTQFHRVDLLVTRGPSRSNSLCTRACPCRRLFAPIAMNGWKYQAGDKFKPFKRLA